MDKNRVRVGIEIGEHTKNPEEFLTVIKENYNTDELGFVLVKMIPEEIEERLFYEWARFFKENDICFAFLYTQQRGAPPGKKSHLSRELVEGIKKIAGDYFVGDMIGETGGLASWPKGYYKEGGMPPQGLDSMQDVKDAYIKHVSEFTELDRSFGVDNVLAVEATAFSRYNFEAGVKTAFLETECGNPVILSAFTRGATRGYGNTEWGSHVAHEWYGGLRNDDPLKYKRLKLAYYYSYLAGANYIYPESGGDIIRSFGYNYGADSKYCRIYRDTWSEFARFAKNDIRGEGPEVKVAFIHGNLDGYTGWGGSTVWNQYDREEWGYSDAEHAWDILYDLNHARNWHEPENYGDPDVSAAPAYGMYDVIPIETPASIMKRYDYLIFAGWNTMTDELYGNLKEYVKNGGNLFLTAAHLNTSARRSGEIKLIYDGRLEEFLGCRVNNSGARLNSGAKFFRESNMPGVLYPATMDSSCDPICAGGFASYADIELIGAEVKAVLTDTFGIDMDDNPRPVLIENRFGKGVVTLLATLEYPGSNSVYPLYRTIVREIFSASHRLCDIQVLSGEKLEFAVYRVGSRRKVYLLNTDYNVPVNAVVLACGKRHEITIPPVSLKMLETEE